MGKINVTNWCINTFKFRIPRHSNRKITLTINVAFRPDMTMCHREGIEQFLQPPHYNLTNLRISQKQDIKLVHRGTPAVLTSTWADLQVGGDRVYRLKGVFACLTADWHEGKFYSLTDERRRRTISLTIFILLCVSFLIEIVEHHGHKRTLHDNCKAHGSGVIAVLDKKTRRRV